MQSDNQEKQISLVQTKSATPSVVQATLITTNKTPYIIYGLIIFYILQLLYMFVYVIYYKDDLIYDKNACYIAVDKFNSYNYIKFDKHNCNIHYCNYMKEIFTNNGLNIPTHYTCITYEYLYFLFYCEINISILFIFALLLLRLYK